jgi:hypothetical protein
VVRQLLSPENLNLLQSLFGSSATAATALGATAHQQRAVRAWAYALPALTVTNKTPNENGRSPWVRFAPLVDRSSGQV